MTIGWATKLITPRISIPFVLAFTINTHAVERFVDLANPDPQPPYLTWATAANDIQSAVDTSVDGDSILVSNGTYLATHTITIAQGVTVRSVNGPEHTIIDGYYSNRCVSMTHSNAVLEGFMVRHGAAPMELFDTLEGYFDEGDERTRGSGIYLGGGRVRDCIVVSNISHGIHSLIATFGVGIYANTNSVIEDCVISMNHVEDVNEAFGAGLYALSSTIRDCKISGNSFSDDHILLKGGGVHAVDSLLEDCTITGHRLDDLISVYGGGVYADGCSIRNCAANDNTGDRMNAFDASGGGIYALDSQIDKVIAEGNRLMQGAMDSSGGGIYLSNGTLKNSLIVKNKIRGDDDVWGGGVMVVGGSVIHCTISSNKAVNNARDTGSSGLHATSGSTVDNCIVYFNGSASNDAQSARNYKGISGSTISSSCVLPLQPGPGNIDGDPQFFDLAATNFRLT
ncbi:MAG: hypothetical protein AAF492_18015, partial [Verrucomicrobiota bacterium]